MECQQGWLFINDRKGPAHLKILLHYWDKQRAYWGKCPSSYIVKKCPDTLINSLATLVLVWLGIEKSSHLMQTFASQFSSTLMAFVETMDLKNTILFLPSILKPTCLQYGFYLWFHAVYDNIREVKMRRTRRWKKAWDLMKIFKMKKSLFYSRNKNQHQSFLM